MTIPQKKLPLLVRKIREYKNNFYKKIYGNNKETIENLDWLIGLNLRDTFCLKSYFLENTPTNFDTEYKYIGHLLVEHPIIFNNNFLAKLYLKTKGRIFLFLDDIEFTESLVMELIREEEKYLNEKMTLAIETKNIDELDEIHKFRHFTEFLPKDFYFKQDYNVREIKEVYEKYFYLIEMNPSLKKLKKENPSSLRYDLNKDKLERMNVINWAEDAQVYFISNLLNTNENVSLDNLQLFWYLIDKSIYSGASFYLKVLRNIDKNFLLEDKFYDYTEELLDKDSKLEIMEKFPNLYLLDENTYKENNLEKILDKISKAYDFQNRKCKLSLEEMRLLRDFLDVGLSENDFFRKSENTNNLDLLGKIYEIDYSQYALRYNQNKYTKETIEKINSLHRIMAKDEFLRLKDNDKNEYAFEIFSEAINIDYIENNITTKDIENLRNYIASNQALFYVTKKKLWDAKISNEFKIDVILSKYPQFLSIEGITNAINPQDIIKKFLLLHPSYYKYYKKEMDEEFIYKLIDIYPDNMKYINKNNLKNMDFIKKLIYRDKNFLKDILTKTKYIKNIELNTEEISDMVYNEFKRSEDSFYLYFLPDEILEALLIKEEINLKNIKEKRTRRKLSKIYIELKEEGVV